MNFTTEEIADLLEAGHHGPTCHVERAVIDPDEVRTDAGQLFVASAHPPPLGDTTLRLEDDIAERVPYLAERTWAGGTAVNGPSTEAIVRAMAGDERGRPPGGDRVGVLGAVAPWVTAALVRAALGDAPVGDAPHEDRLAPSGPPGRREPTGTERFRMPLALMNHSVDAPLAVVLNRQHRGCTGADAALLSPTAVVMTDLGERHLAMLGPTGALDATRDVLDRLDPGVPLVMPETVAEALRSEVDLDLTRSSALTTFRAQFHHGSSTDGTVEVAGPWGEMGVELGSDGGALALPVGAAVAVGMAAGRNPRTVRSNVGATAQTIAQSMVVRLAEGAIVWDRSDATSFGDVSAAIDALAGRNASGRFLVLGQLDDGPTVIDRLHARLGRQATDAGIVVRSADAWGSGASFLEHPRLEADDLAAAGPGAVVMLVGGGHELLSVRRQFLERAGMSP